MTVVLTKHLRFLYPAEVIFALFETFRQRCTLEMSSSDNAIEFVSTDLERYKCIECRYVLQDPVQSSCGHR